MQVRVKVLYVLSHTIAMRWGYRRLANFMHFKFNKHKFKLGTSFIERSDDDPYALKLLEILATKLFINVKVVE